MGLFTFNEQLVHLTVPRISLIFTRMFSTEIIKTAAELGKTEYPRGEARQLQYGTAGFREKADDLPHVLFRMGLLATIRSANTKGAVGVMITASHNPVADNGVKLVDPSGEMLAPEWEQLATRLANAKDEDLASCLSDIADKNPPAWSETPYVFLGRDTRPSSTKLSEAARRGAEVLGAKVRDFGEVTTPQLHFVVASRNAGGALGMPTEEGYIYSMTGPFSELRGEVFSKGNYQPVIDFDGANGIGAPKMKMIQKILGASLTVNFYNDGDGVLNEGCGADFVKVQQQAPRGLETTKNRGVSVDGDADRIIYFYHDEEGKFHMLDGDKIATLVAGYLQELLTESGCDLSLGIVQTAYANGASTDYISKELKVPVACEPTGVKHLHHRAAQFDVGVYFEANGHGTVLFSGKAREQLQNEGLPTDQRSAARKLWQLSMMINQSTGDALADLLLVETILHSRGWAARDWDLAYTDLPNRQLKVKVKDRNAVTTTDAERRCVLPEGLQDKIDAAVATKDRGRAFVRPSGTEDVVRVYAEAATQLQADQLANEVAQATYDLAGGTHLALIPL